jgi:hypothetical protein
MKLCFLTMEIYCILIDNLLGSNKILDNNA